MKNAAFLVRAMLVIVPAGLLFASHARGESPKTSDVEKGGHLVQVLGCNDCHSPKVFDERGPSPDRKRLLSGHPADEKLPPVPAGVMGPNAWGGLYDANMTAWVGPWGTSFASNLTPDVETGIGFWTEDMFVKAIRNGKLMGAGRPLLPPMPWPAYANLSDEELHDIFVYLKSLPPIKNEVPKPLPPQTAPTAGE